MNSSRKSHKKSRAGCVNCKRRKIKCDERRPECTPCLKHSVSCFYPQTPATSKTTMTVPDYGNNAFHQPLSSRTVKTNNSPIPPTLHPTASGPGQAMNMLDLELLHNFVTSTSYSLSYNAELKTMWRISVPQIAFAHEYVMHAILALSAYHLAKFRREKADFYSAHAASHHQIAIHTVNGILPDVTRENCAALHMFSTITCIIGCANPHKQDSLLLVAEKGVAEWILLIRGACTVSRTSTDWLVEGPLAPMFLIPGRINQVKGMPTTGPWDEAFTLLQQRIENTVKDTHALETYRESIDALVALFPAVYHRGPAFCGVSEVFKWIYHIPDAYLSLLHQHKQEALVILAHFCVILKQIDGFWWTNDLWETLLSTIYNHLTEEYRIWIRWPMEEMGWMPS